MTISFKSTLGPLLFASTLASVPVAAEAASVAIVSTSLAVMASATAAGMGDPEGSEHLVLLPAYSVAGVIVSVAAMGVGTIVLLKTTIDGSTQVVKLALKGLQKGSLAVGQTITAVSTEAGHILLSEGKLLAFAPNETGRQLLYNEELGQ